ncbi:MAG: cyclic nucleotide-binding domain-containing protein [Woeseiaceae bacterium]|nr:cyclic nucleotide-binding domain-containing protein [Woeseiaceae bacterium]NIP19695.1 cyclic nucleotide-binding domain-containing protein [Woeseiaceae bacterium]NIS89812.1 cyclic nucleotide-binding domain-containing protein [Woeseiaceae bacterium]
MSDLPIAAILSHNFLFEGLPDSIIDEIASLAHRSRLSKGTLIFCQGDDGDALYGIASGRVRIFTADGEGHEVFLNVLGPGDTFGEIALLDGLPRTASAIAVTPSVLVVIPRRQFLAYLDHQPKLALHLMVLLCERLRWVSNLLEDTSFLAGPARVAKRLTVLVERYGRPAGGGGIELRISQADLGHFLGISRQIVNHYLRDWCERGWITLKRGRIIIHDSKALEGIFVSTS